MSWSAIGGRSSRGSVDRNTPGSVQGAAMRVAPHAGAWIETGPEGQVNLMPRVAPHAGAWIETGIGASAGGCDRSLLTRERGSKQPHRPRAGGRGLVAPHAGAWIETSSKAERQSELSSLLTRERGSNIGRVTSVAQMRGRSSRGSVDRNQRIVVARRRGRRRSSRGSVDRNIHSRLEAQRQATVAPHAGAWIETKPPPGARIRSGVAPHAGAWIETASHRRPPAGTGGRSSRGSVDRNVDNVARAIRHTGSLLTRERGSKPA